MSTHEEDLAWMRALFGGKSSQEETEPAPELGNHVAAEGHNPSTTDQHRKDDLNFARSVFGYDPN